MQLSQPRQKLRKTLLSGVEPFLGFIRWDKRIQLETNLAGAFVLKIAVDNPVLRRYIIAGNLRCEVGLIVIREIPCQRIIVASRSKKRDRHESSSIVPRTAAGHQYGYRDKEQY